MNKIKIPKTIKAHCDYSYFESDINLICCDYKNGCEHERPIGKYTVCVMNGILFGEKK